MHLLSQRILGHVSWPWFPVMVASRHLVLYGIRKLCITLDAPTATQTHMRVHSCYVGEIPYAPSRQIVDRIIASIKFNINDGGVHLYTSDLGTTFKN